MLMHLASALMIATLALMAWFVYQGWGEKALYLFFLGASVALLLRRRHEIKAGQTHGTSQSPEE